MANEKLYYNNSSQQAVYRLRVYCMYSVYMYVYDDMLYGDSIRTDFVRCSPSNRISIKMIVCEGFCGGPHLAMARILHLYIFLPWMK